MTAIGIESISVFGMPPVEFVRLAADLDCRHISIGLSRFDFGVCGYPAYTLRDDAALRRETIAALRDTGVSISLGEGLTIRPGVTARDYAADLGLFGELGVTRVNTVSMDPDRSRTFDEFAVLAELAAACGMVTTVEFAPSLTLASLDDALAAIAYVGRPDFRLLLDTMHFVRSGGRPEDIAALEPGLIDYIQVSDATRLPRFASYFEEAMFERMVPGEGELGLAALFAVLPADRIHAIEVPLRAAAKDGASARDRLGRCVAATRRLLADVTTARI